MIAGRERKRACHKKKITNETVFHCSARAGEDVWQSQLWLRLGVEGPCNLTLDLALTWLRALGKSVTLSTFISPSVKWGLE